MDNSVYPRIGVRKTYKLFINGQFVRSESGRHVKISNPSNGKFIANVPRGSKKDLRDAVKSARAGFVDWSGRTAYNRGQILYRSAEILEQRKAEFIDELRVFGADKESAEREVAFSIDRLVWYAGWCDKFQHIFGAINSVAAPFTNFSSPEPTGVVGVVCAESPSLLGFVSAAAPVVTGGNSCVVVPSESGPLAALSLCEVFASGDMPPGVVNVVTGYRSEILPQLANHMDVNALLYAAGDEREKRLAQEAAATNVKRVFVEDLKPQQYENSQSPYHIARFLEIKTVWHPKAF